MYLTYEKYQAWGGGMELAAFSRYGYQAERMVDSHTFGRVKTMKAVPETVERLVFALTELMGETDLGTKRVNSESVGPWSKSYHDTAREERQAAILELVRSHLSNETDGEGTPLLYRGV